MARLIEIMILISAALFNLQFYFYRIEADRQMKTYIHVCDGARIDSTPISELKNVEDAGACALACFENTACNSFAFNLVIGQQCHLFLENLEQMRVLVAEKWAVFAIKHTSGMLILRHNPNDNPSFDQEHKAYENGFGDVELGNYWIGLKKLHELTQTARRLKIVVIQKDGDDKLLLWEEFQSFKVGPPEDQYRLHLNGRNNQSTTPLPGFSDHSNVQFTTVRDNSKIICPSALNSGWWYTKPPCSTVMLTSKRMIWIENIFPHFSRSSTVILNATMFFV